MYKLRDELQFVYDSFYDKMVDLSFVQKGKELCEEAIIRDSVFRYVPAGLIQFRDWAEAKKAFKDY